MDFDHERKYCDQCKRYVRFLTSLNESYCVHCDGKVTVFSKKDMKVSLVNDGPVTIWIDSCDRARPRKE